MDASYLRDGRTMEVMAGTVQDPNGSGVVRLTTDSAIDSSPAAG